MLHRIGILLGCILAVTPAFSQQGSQPIVIGETTTIRSRVLDEPRQVYVATPSSYDQAEERYGVLYVLDGDSQFHHTVASARFLGGFANQSIPPQLVVGIGNTNRMRDLTPPSEAQGNQFMAQGGADTFLEFIVEELQPWVEARYRTSEYSVLIGHSLGGLFALHTFITQPDAFDGFLVIDPSLNWNSQSLVRQFDTFIASDPDLNASLYLAVSSDDGSGLDGARRLAGSLNAGASEGLRWTLASLVAESHDSIPLPGIYQGLRWVFSAWDVDDQAEAIFSDAPADAILADVDEIYRRSGARYGLARQTPYLVFESLLSYLAENDRLEEAAELTLRHSDRYPLPLVPNVIAGMAQMFVDSGDTDAAIAYLSAVLEIYPGDETARKVLIDLGVDPSAE